MIQITPETVPSLLALLDQLRQRGSAIAMSWGMPSGERDRYGMLTLRHDPDLGSMRWYVDGTEFYIPVNPENPYNKPLLSVAWYEVAEDEDHAIIFITLRVPGFGLGGMSFRFPKA